MTTHLVPNRQEALRVGFEATDWPYFLDYEAYVRQIKDWDIQAIERDGKCIGAVFSKGTEVHVSVLPEWRKHWATKGLLKQLFSRGLVTTRVTPGHEYMHDILTRLGFVKLDNGVFVKGH